MAQPPLLAVMQGGESRTSAIRSQLLQPRFSADDAAAVVRVTTAGVAVAGPNIAVAVAACPEAVRCDAASAEPGLAALCGSRLTKVAYRRTAFGTEIAERIHPPPARPGLTVEH